MLLFMDDYILMQDTGDQLQHSIYNAYNNGEMYNLQVSIKKKNYDNKKKMFS